MINRHTIAQNAGYQLCIVPIFRVELLAQSLHCSFVSPLVFKLKIIAMRAILNGRLDDLAFSDILWQYNSFLIILQTSEDFIRITIEQAHKSHPFLLVVLETNNITFEFFRPYFCHFRTNTLVLFRCIFPNICAFCMTAFLLVFLRNRYHYPRTATIPIDSTTLATALPGFNIKTIHKTFVDIMRQIDCHGDAMIHPFLYSALHLYLHQPVNIIGGSFIIR